MANKAKIGASIVLDGEKKYKEAVTGCNNKLKELRAELGLVKEKYAENANSSEALEKKAKALNAILDEQKNKEAKTKEAKENAEKSRDELKASVRKLKNEYEQEKKKLEEIAKASGTSTEEYRSQKKVVEELEKAHHKGENTLKRAENRVSNWTTKLTTAKTQSLRAGKAVEQNAKYIDEAKASFDNCAKSIDRYGKKTKDTEQYTKEAFTKLAGVMTASGIKDTVENVARSLQECAEAAEKFGASSAKVGTIADTSKISMQKLDNQMLALSSSTGKGVSDIAESTYQAISASVDSSKAVGTVGTATKLATGGFTEASTAIDGLTTVMNSYGDKVKDASEVSDVFITVQNQGKTTVDELASSIGRVATNAANYNVSIQDLGAAYIEMTKRGVETSEATTYSNSMLKELAKNGSTVSEILKKKTGKSFAELMEDGKSLGDVIGILSSSVGGNATEFSNLWSSQEAGTAATILLKTGTEEYNKTLQNVKSSAGATEKAYAKMTNTTEHAKEVMQNGIENLKIAIGSELNVALERLYKVGGSISDWAQNVLQECPLLSQAIGAVTVTMGTFTGGMVAFSGATKIVIPLIKDLWLAIKANPMAFAATAIAAVVAGLAAFALMQKEANAVTDKEIVSVNKATKAITEKNKALEDNVKANKKALDSTKDDVTNTDNLVTRLLSLNGTQKKTLAQKKEMKAIVDNLKGKIPQLAKAYDEETGSLDLTESAVKRLAEAYKQEAITKGMQEQLTKAVKEEAEAQTNLAKAKENAQKASEKQQKAANEEEAAFQKMKRLGANANKRTFESTDFQEARKEYEEKEKKSEAATKAAQKADKAEKECAKTQKNAAKTVKEATDYYDAYSKKLEEANQKTKKSSSTTKSTSKQYTSVSAAFKKAEQDINATNGKLSASTKKSFDHVVKIAKKTGTDIPAGLTKGLKNGSKSPEGATKSIKDAITKKLQALTKEARKSGIAIPTYITKGLKDGTMDVGTAYDKINGQIAKASDKQQDKLKKAGIKITDKMKNTYQKGGEASLQQIQKSNEKLEKLMQNVGVNSLAGLIKGVDKKKPEVIEAYQKCASDIDKAFRKKLDIRSPSRKFQKSGVYTVEGLIKGIESKKGNLKKTANELGEILNTKLQNLIEMKELRNYGKGYSQGTITKYWQGVVKATKKGTSAHTEALKNYYQARNDLLTQKKDYITNLRSSFNDKVKEYKENIQSAKDEITQLRKDLEQSIQDTQSSISGTWGLFSKAGTSKTNNAEGLIANMASQYDTIAKWQSNMEQLRSRGLSSDLIKDLESAGVSSAGDVSTLAGMTQEQLMRYQEYYNQRNAIARKEAEKENSSLTATTNQQIASYSKQITGYNNQLEKLKKSTKKKLKAFQKNLAKQMKELGKNTAEGFAKGITKGNNSVVAAIAQMTGQTVSQIKKNLGIHSPSRVMAELGGYTGAGFAIGLTKETEGLSQIITDALPKTVDSPAVQGTSVVTPDTAVAAKDSSQLNLYIDSRLIGSAVYRQIDLLQGADIQLRQRGLVR